MKKYLIQFGNALKKAILGYIEDIFIFSGIGFICLATFLLSEIAGFYCLGLCLFGLGVWFTRNPVRR